MCQCRFSSTTACRTLPLPNGSGRDNVPRPRVRRGRGPRDGYPEGVWSVQRIESDVLVRPKSQRRVPASLPPKQFLQQTPRARQGRRRVPTQRHIRPCRAPISYFTLRVFLRETGLHAPSSFVLPPADSSSPAAPRRFVQICLALHHVHSKRLLHRGAHSGSRKSVHSPGCVPSHFTNSVRREIDSAALRPAAGPADIKSQNIFLSGDQHIIKLGDFGISRVSRARRARFLIQSNRTSPEGRPAVSHHACRLPRRRCSPAATRWRRLRSAPRTTSARRCATGNRTTRNRTCGANPCGSFIVPLFERPHSLA